MLSSASFKLKTAAGEYVAQTVYYPTQQEIDTFVTDETGGVTLPETVTWGLYYLEEVKAPEGYLLPAEDLAVFVGHDGDSPGDVSAGHRNSQYAGNGAHLSGKDGPDANRV